jgi:hypothetical protein
MSASLASTMAGKMEGPRVALLEDQQTQRDELVLVLKTKSLVPVSIEQARGTSGELAREIEGRHVSLALCDQNLYGMTNTTGAEVVAKLTDDHVPAILYSEQKDEIPHFRHLLNRIPRFFDRDEIEKLDLKAEAVKIASEFGNEPLEKRPYRTLLRIEDVINGDTVAFLVPAWDGNQCIEMSMRGFPERIRPKVIAGSRLFAKVNLHALDKTHLFVTDVQEPRES